MQANQDIRASTAAFGQRNIAIYNQKSDDGIFSAGRPVTNQIAIKTFDQSTEETNNGLLFSELSSKKKLDDLVLSQAAALNNRTRSVDKNSQAIQRLLKNGRYDVQTQKLNALYTHHKIRNLDKIYSQTLNSTKYYNSRILPF